MKKVFTACFSRQKDVGGFYASIDGLAVKVKIKVKGLERLVDSDDLSAFLLSTPIENLVMQMYLDSLRAIGGRIAAGTAILKSAAEQHLEEGSLDMHKVYAVVLQSVLTGAVTPMRPANLCSEKLASFNQAVKGAMPIMDKLVKHSDALMGVGDELSAILKKAKNESK